jgi:hypothetical protein
MTPLVAQAFEQNTGNLAGGGATVTQAQPSGLDITYGVTGSDLVAAPGGGMSGRGAVAANFISGFSTSSSTLRSDEGFVHLHDPGAARQALTA